MIYIYIYHIHNYWFCEPKVGERYSSHLFSSQLPVVPHKAVAEVSKIGRDA